MTVTGWGVDRRYIVLLNPNFCIKVNQLRKFSTVKDISLRTLQVGEISSTTLQRLGIRYTEKIAFVVGDDLYEG